MSQSPPHNSDLQQPDANSKQPDSSTSQNVIQGNQNRAVQGNENKAVLGDGNAVIHSNASAGKDLLQIGRDYIRHIQVNILSGNWGAVIVALAPFFILTVLSGGVGFGGGASVTKQQFSSNLRTKDSEIRNLKQKVTDVKAQQPAFDEQRSKLVKSEQTIKTLQTELNEKEQILNQQKQTINVLKRQLNEKEEILSQQEQTVNDLNRQLNEKEQTINALKKQLPQEPDQSSLSSTLVCSKPPISKVVDGLRLQIEKIEKVNNLLRFHVKIYNQNPEDRDLNFFHSQLYFHDNLGKLYDKEDWGIRIPGSNFTTSSMILKEPIQPNASTISVNIGNVDGNGKKLCISGIPVK